MSLKIRLARAGTKKRPYYHIVIADSRSPRDGRFIERLGHFNPLLPKDNETRLKLDLDKVKAWLAKGALPTDRVLRFLDEAGVMKREARNNPEKAKPKKKAQERPRRRNRGGTGGLAPPASAGDTGAGRPALGREAADGPPRQADDRWPLSACSSPASARPRAARRGAAVGVHGRSDGGEGLRAASNRRRKRGFAIEALRPGKNFLVARFAGVNDRTAAEALRNIDLYVPRDRLPPTEAEEFYHADLIGLAAVTTDGRPLGTVVAVHDFGAGELVEIRPETGRTVMVPFTEAVVPVVDVAGGRIVVDPPEGLLPSPAGAEDAPGGLSHVARERADHLPRNVSRAAGREPRRQGARRRPLVARCRSTSGRTRPTSTARSTTRRRAAAPAW